jgi:transposase InsO family protein
VPHARSLEERLLRLERQAAFGQRDRADAALTQRIAEIHRRSRQTYGSPRIHAALKALGTRCSGKRVERLMRKAGLQGCMRARRKGSTCGAKRVAPGEDLVKRNFAATQANRVWVADITYVATREGFLYLAFILDLHWRRIIGWAMESHLRTELVVDALREWLCVGGSPLLLAWCIIGTKESSTQRSHCAKGSGRLASPRRWEGPGAPWTERHGRELRFNAESGAGEQAKVPNETGSENGYLRVRANVLQHPPSALICGLQESCGLRGGWNGRC